MESGQNKPGSELDSSVDMNVGGQAVIEGVMMRSPDAIATAVRLPDGSIEIHKKPYKSFVKRHTAFDVPVIRGAISFFEMLVIGMQTLNWSADIQMQYEDREQGRDTEKSSLINNLMLGGSIAFAIVFSLGLFFALPIYVATLLGFSKGALQFNLIAGAVRLSLFLLYVLAISFMPDIKRLFRYHGAEHMSIFTLEASEPLVVESARGRSRLHPRCGTSFILIVAMFSMVLFGIADSIFPMITGHVQSFPERLVTHLLLLPFVAGTSFELLKLSGKFRSNPVTKMLIAPGLWLQRLTTAEPDDEMIEVALCALSAALGTEEASS